MKRSTILIIIVAAAVLGGPSGVCASPAKPSTKPPAAVKPQVKVTTAKAPKPQTVKPVKRVSHPPKPAKAVKPGKAKPVHATAASKPVKPPKASKSSTTTTSTKRAESGTSSTTSTATTTTTTSTTPVALTPVQQKLQKNTKLASKLQGRLPIGTDLMVASAGFKNLGQFVAAVNVSNNLQIPFVDLKTKMVTDGLSLGGSIQALRPASSAAVEASRAEYDARGMILETEATSPTQTTIAPASQTTTAPVSQTSTATTTKVKVKARSKTKVKATS